MQVAFFRQPWSFGGADKRGLVPVPLCLSHAETHLSLLLLLGASFTPRGSPEIDDAPL